MSLVIVVLCCVVNEELVFPVTNDKVFVAYSHVSRLRSICPDTLRMKDVLKLFYLSLVFISLNNYQKKKKKEREMHIHNLNGETFLLAAVWPLMKRYVCIILSSAT